MPNKDFLKPVHRDDLDADVVKAIEEQFAESHPGMKVVFAGDTPGGPTEEMQAIALKHRPHACCLVPERRAEVTTEGGLAVAGQHNVLTPFVAALRAAGIRVSLFIDPAPEQIEAAAKVGADIIEMHTGRYCEAALEGDPATHREELRRLVDGARLADSLGLEVHAGHGLTFDTVGPVAEIPEIVELNIGHFLIGEAIFSGLHSAVIRMKSLMERARAASSGVQSA